MALNKRNREEEAVLGDGRTWVRGPLVGVELSGPVYLASGKKPKWRETNSPAIMVVKSAAIADYGPLQEEKETLRILEKGRPYIRECFGDEITVDHDGKLVYNLLLEYNSGGTLCHMMARTSGMGLSEAEVSYYTRNIVHGLHHIHQIGYEIDHLRPETIMLVPMNDSSQGVAAAKYMAKIGDFRLVTKDEKLQKGMMSDIWLLGCLVLEMLSGINPWNFDFVNYIWRTEGNRDAEDDEFLSWLSEEARDFMECCLGRGTTQKLTPEMLLEHPFLAASRENKRSKNAPSCLAIDDCESSSSSCSCTEDIHVINISSDSAADKIPVSSCNEADGEIYFSSTYSQGFIPQPEIKESNSSAASCSAAPNGEMYFVSTCSQPWLQNKELWEDGSEESTSSISPLDGADADMYFASNCHRDLMSLEPHISSAPEANISSAHYGVDEKNFPSTCIPVEGEEVDEIHSHWTADSSKADREIHSTRMEDSYEADCAKMYYCPSMEDFDEAGYQIYMKDDDEARYEADVEIHAPSTFHQKTVENLAENLGSKQLEAMTEGDWKLLQFSMECELFVW